MHPLAESLSVAVEDSFPWLPVQACLVLFQPVKSPFPGHSTVARPALGHVFHHFFSGFMTQKLHKDSCPGLAPFEDAGVPHLSILHKVCISPLRIRSSAPFYAHPNPFIYYLALETKINTKDGASETTWSKGFQ